jgi:hypothetical protein
MAKRRGGTHHQQGVLRKGTQPQPNPTHAGSGAPKGQTHTSQPPLRVHGGSGKRQGSLQRK